MKAGGPCKYPEMLILLCPPRTELEEKDHWLGNLDSVLSQIGKAEAAEIDRIQNDRAYVAPMNHVREYAHIVLENDVTVIDAFADRSMGNLTGRSYRETLEEFPRRNWLSWQRSYWTAPPEGESLFDISDRVLTAFSMQVQPVTAKETVAVIAPANVLRLIIGFLTKIEEEKIPEIKIEANVPYVINGELNISAA